MEKRVEVSVRVGLMSLLASIAACLYPIPNTSAAPLDRLAPTVNLLAENPDTSADGPTDPEVSAMPASGFVDQYLTEEELASDAWYEDPFEQRPGRRFISTELVYYNNTNDIIGDETEQGIRARWRQETLNFGEFDTEIVFSDSESDFLGRNRSSSEVMMTFRQTGAPVANHWTMNNTVGYQRTLVDSLLHSSYRVRLPTSPLLGMSGEFINTNKNVQWFTGKTGRYEGIALQQFDQNGGDITGGSYQQKLTPQVALGGEVVKFSGNDLVPSHTSVLTAARFAQPDRTLQYDLHLLADTNSSFGVWADGMHILPADFVTRYGAFYLQPDLAWMDKPISNDQSGYYIRTDKQAFIYNFSGGYDYMQTGLDSDAQTQINSHAFFLNGSYRITRNLTLGTSANIMFRKITSLQDDNQTLWRLNNFAYYRYFLGTTRLELFATRLSSDFQTNNDDTLGVRISHDWRMPQSLRLNTEILLEEGQRFIDDRGRQEASIMFRQNLTDNISWGINTSAFRNTGDRLPSTTGVGISADARWKFLRDWYVSMSLVHNTTMIDNDSGLSGFNDNPKANSIWLTLGYARTSGQPYASFGRSNGGVGSGSIEGEVFYDENGDSIRQPGERPAVGLTVLLDGRYEARTDSRGRYMFQPVHTGTHGVALITEDVPLPWGIYDEAPRAVRVNLRQSAEANFALVTIN